MDGSTLRHTFFKKACSTELVVLWRSALPGATKRSTLYAEGMRRVFAMDPKTWEEEGHKVMGTYMNMLRLSGYDTKYRHQILA